jgi:hypothetical protein
VKHYRLTLWITHEDTAGALRVDTYATTPGRAIDAALDKYRLPASAVIGWEAITKQTSREKVSN